MKYHFNDKLVNANLTLIKDEPYFHHSFFSKSLQPVLTIAWNKGTDDQIVVLDGTRYLFPTQSFILLVVNQTFHFENAQDVVLWQFDKPLYCIEDNDKEVSCIGFLFWGSKGYFAIKLDETSASEFETILSFFINEFQLKDHIQGEMLRALLKRMILKLYYLAKEQVLQPDFSNEKLDIVRQYNVLVEKHFRTMHQVKDYAKLMYKSPKTLTNVFALYNNKSPLQVIHQRIVIEAKRLLLYTDMPVKEIAESLGFTEIPHFSRLFKSVAKLAPVEFRTSQQNTVSVQD